MSSLNGSWIEIFRAGDYGERGEWTAQDLDRLAAAYNPRLQPAPVVVGHPEDDAPAYGWVARLRRAGQSLWAQLEKVDAGFEKLLREGRFQQRSVALYRQFAPTGAPYLRHVGFLGAQPPAVKGLAPVRFAADSLVEFSETLVGQTLLPATPETQAGMPAPLPPHPITEDTVTPIKLETFIDHLRNFFTGEESCNTSANMNSKDSLEVTDAPKLLCDLPAPAVSALPNTTFEERLDQIEQRLETLSKETPAATIKLAETEKQAQRSAIENFVEILRRRGSFPPAFDRLGVAEFMQRLATADTASAEAGSGEETHSGSSSAVLSGRDFPVLPAHRSLGEGGSEVEGSRAKNSAAPVATEEEVRGNPRWVSPEEDAARQPLLSWFQEFLSQLPRVIEFNELTPGQRAGQGSTSPAARVIRFTEPRRGVEVDLASVELAERAEAFAAEQGVTYAEALVQLRHSQRESGATA